MPPSIFLFLSKRSLTFALRSSTWVFHLSTSSALLMTLSLTAFSSASTFLSSALSPSVHSR
eukprot:8051288-Pyramimonas_sp.AAC.1